MKKERYPYIGNPYGFKLPEPNPIVHPIIKKWDDFSESDKEIFSNIKKKIVDISGDCKISAFGSRIRGNWIEGSDYDIMISQKLSDEQLYAIKNIDYGVKVDIFVYEHDGDAPVFSIEII